MLRSGDARWRRLSGAIAAWRSCEGARRETVRWQRVASETPGAHWLPSSRPGTVTTTEVATGPWRGRPWRRWPGSDSEVLVPAIEAKGGLNPSIGFSGESKDSTAAPERGTTSPSAAPAHGGTPASHGCGKTGASLVRGSSNFTTECARTGRNSTATPRYARCPGSVRTAVS